MSEKKLTAKIYTDGGCWPNPGYGGSGFHGTLSNGKTYDGWWSIPYTTTNNGAEVIAGLKAVEFAIENNVSKLNVYPDSEYLIKGITQWHHGWAKKDWKTASGEDVKNKKEWLELIDAVNRLQNSGATIHWQWVKGHSDVVENERADENATRGRIAAAKGQEVAELAEHDTKKYGKTKPPKYSRMFAMDKWYFCSDKPEVSPSGYYTYHCGYHGKPDAKERDDRTDTALGKPLADSYHSVVYLKEPSEVLENIRKEHYALFDTSLGLPNVGVLSKINSASAYHELEKHGGTYLHLDTKQQRHLQTIHKVPLSHIANPPKLAFDAMETLANHQTRLELYVTDKYPENEITDITDMFWEVEVNGKGKKKTALKKEVDNTLKSMSVEVNHAKGKGKITLTLGIDLPVRNTLSYLKDSSPSLKVITWLDGDIGFRYATILSTDEGHLLWCASYANLEFIK